MTLRIVTPAADLAILTKAELRELGASQDLGLEAAEWIANLCGVPAADGLPPTLWAETLEETQALKYCASSIGLARRFVSDVTVTEGGAAVDTADFSIDASMGRLWRLSTGAASVWGAVDIVINYKAGLSSMPPAVKGVARDFVRMRLSQTDSNPIERSVNTQGVDAVSYFDRSAVSGAFEEEARRRLSRFMIFSM